MSEFRNKRTNLCWAVRWESGKEENTSGRTEHLIGEANGTTQTDLFRTRAEAREWRDERYGYIRKRKDLLKAPHFWKIPRVVRVRVSIWEAA